MTKDSAFDLLIFRVPGGSAVTEKSRLDQYLSRESLALLRVAMVAAPKKDCSFWRCAVPGYVNPFGC
jgi:hypothetical protein